MMNIFRKTKVYCLFSIIAIAPSWISCDSDPYYMTKEATLAIVDIPNVADTLFLSSLFEINEETGPSYLRLSLRPTGDGKINDQVYFSVIHDLDPRVKCTPAEWFAIESIRKRNKELTTVFENNPTTSHAHNTLSTIYMREAPRVMADKPLFGKAPGEDLSSFFLYEGGTTLLKVKGLDYQVDYTPQRGQSLKDYFSEDTIMPLGFDIRSTGYPQELQEDKNVILTMVFPVMVEHYWSWLFELYDNPEAQEQFSEMEIVATIDLRKAKKSTDKWVPYDVE